MFDEGGWLMQKNGTNLIPPSHSSHRLDKMAKPYLYWLYIFACLPMLIMFCLMFVDTEGIRFEGLEFTFSNFSILIQRSTFNPTFSSVFTSSYVCTTYSTPSISTHNS